MTALRVEMETVACVDCGSRRPIATGLWCPACVARARERGAQINPPMVLRFVERRAGGQMRLSLEVTA